MFTSVKCQVYNEPDRPGITRVMPLKQRPSALYKSIVIIISLLSLKQRKLKHNGLSLGRCWKSAFDVQLIWNCREAAQTCILRRPSASSSFTTDRDVTTEAIISSYNMLPQNDTVKSWSCLGHVLLTRSSAVAETARCFVIEYFISHSSSLKINGNDTLEKGVSPY